MMRRRIAAGAGVVLLIVIVLVVNGCLKSQKTEALKSYTRNVSEIIEESDQKVSRPLFAALSSASSGSALDVEQKVDELHSEAESQAQRAKGLSVPGEMEGAQRNLLLAMDLRSEGVMKVGNLLRTALGGQAKQASTLIAGNMENFLASDVLYSQRVAPLIEENLKSGGVEGETLPSSNFLPNLGWLEPSTVQSRISGQGSTGSQNGQLAPGTHGSALIGVAVGSNSLATEPTLNHVSGGSNPTFTVTVEDSGENSETNVKVNVTVTAQGKQLKATRTINSMQAGSKMNVDIPVENVPAGPGKIEVYVEPVPGETDTENNKSTYLAIFSS
jgi:hypothetical protein